MEILDWLFIGLLSLAILSFVFTVIAFVFMWSTTGKLNQLKKKRPKKKLKRKKWRRHYQRINNKRQRELKLGLLLLVVSCLSLGSSFYSRYYQMRHLGEKDSTSLVQGYYLVSEINELFKQVSETSNPKKVENTMKELSGRLASYGARSADGRLSDEGRILLNHLYLNMKELGLNMNKQTVETLQVKDTYEGYAKDIKKTQENQKKVFEYFNIDEASLKNKK